MNNQMAQKPPKVLVDYCAMQHGLLIGRAVEEVSTAMWGGVKPVTLGVVRLQGRKLPPGAHWLRAEIKCLASVTAAMESGQLAAYTYSELIAERMMGRDGWSGLRGDLWRNVSFLHVPPPLERSTWMGGLNLDQYSSREHQAEFCERLLQFEKNGVPKQFLEALDLDEFQLRNLRRLSELRDLCGVVGRSMWCDAFHLWTALCSDLDYFLTTDEKFLRVVREGCANPALQTPAVSPSELVNIFDLHEVPLPIKEGEIVPFPFD